MSANIVKGKRRKKEVELFFHPNRILYSIKRINLFGNQILRAV